MSSVSAESAGDSSPQPQSISADQAKELARLVWSALGVQPPEEGFSPQYSEGMAGDVRVLLCGYSALNVKIEAYAEHQDEEGLLVRTTTEYHIVEGDPAFMCRQEPIDPTTGKPIKLKYYFPDDVPYQMFADAVQAHRNRSNLITEERLQDATALIAQVF